MKKFSFICIILVLFIFIGCGGSESEDCPTIDGNMWSSRSSETMNRWDAVDYCEELNECGYSDWRLPDINELRMLIKNCPETQTGGACPVKDPKSLDIYYGEKCGCEEKENNGGYYSKLGDDDSVVLRSSSIFDHVDGCVVTTLGWVVDFSSGSINNDEYSSSYYYCVLTPKVWTRIKKRWKNGSKSLSFGVARAGFDRVRVRLRRLSEIGKTARIKA